MNSVHQAGGQAAGTVNKPMMIAGMPVLSDSGVDAGVQPHDASTPPRASGPGDWVAGDYPSDLFVPYLEIKGVPGQRDLVRQYKVHVPASYQREKPMPLVFCIHGLGQDPNLFCLSGAKLDKAADQAGFILVMPLGYESSWNGGTCCGRARDEKLDDVALIRAILADVAKHLNVDLERVYTTGLSNGGYLSYRLACEAPDLFAGVVVGSGAVGINAFPDKADENPELLSVTSNFTDCAPSRPLSILHLHGTADGYIPHTLQAKSLMLMAEKYGCSQTSMPAVSPNSAGDSSCVTYAGCSAGVELTGCTVEGGGHCWFGSDDCGTGAGFLGMAFVGENSDTLDNNHELLEFLQRHPAR